MNRRIKNARKRSAHAKHETGNFRMICHRIANAVCARLIEKVKNAINKLLGIQND